MAIRVLVCGGRTYADMHRVCEVLNEINIKGGIALVMHGGASGADEFANTWARVTFTQCKVFLADWHRHGKKAGPLRNQRMLDEGRPDLVVAFAGGSGTRDMVKRARRSGVEIMEVA